MMTFNNISVLKFLFFTSVFLVITCYSALSQSVAINGTNQDPHPSAILDVSSHSKGMLIPRLNLATIENITNPPDGLWVYQTDGSPGFYFSQNGAWFKFSQKEYDSVPIGSVIDWLPQGQSLPDAYKVCDGSLITDIESPFYNENIPDLNGKFIKAVNINAIGSEGGSNTHTHLVNFGTPNTTIANVTHTHTASQVNTVSNSVSHTHSFPVPIVSSVTHSHEWARLNSNENWRSFTSNGSGITMVNWTDGMGAEGSGHYPITIHSSGGLSQDKPFYTDSHTHTHTTVATPNINSHSHFHDVIVPGVLENANAIHNHSVNIGNRSTSTDTHTPPHIKLLKIMRIK